MDNYQAITNWAIFSTGVLGLGYYYYRTTQQRKPDRHREDTQHLAAKRRRSEQENRGRQNRRPTPEGSADVDQGRSTIVDAGIKQSSGDATRKRKLATERQAQPPSVVVQGEEPEEIDMGTKQWAEQMMQTRKGHELSSGKSNEQRVKTVKQSSALNTPVLSSGSSQAGAEADDDMSPAASPGLNAGDVSDMLEPVGSGPSTLRVTAATKPQKEKVARESKDEQVETKKQRQNRQRVEERRLQREAEEKERRALEEKQRRQAREARGEPAKNGMQSAKAPAASAWMKAAATPGADAPTIPTVNGNHNAPLLDTFDAESLSSSNGGLEASTTATSINSAGAATWDNDLPSEEEQMAHAMKESGDDSGWTTVAQPKKTKKKAETPVAEPLITNKTNIPTTKPATNGKPKGFQALDVQYEQRTDADPNDASNWDP